VARVPSSPGLSPMVAARAVTFRTRSGTVRHEGFSVHVSESLTRGGDRTPRKQSKRGKLDWVTSPAKPWITSTLGGQAKLRAVAQANSEQASKDESRVPTLPFCGEGHAGQRDPRRTLARPAGVWGTARSEGRWINVGDPPRGGVATLTLAAGQPPRRKSERPMVPTKPVTTVEGRGLTSGCLGSGQGCGD
jgi:hypothetical protein